MNDLPRQKLKEIIMQHGRTLCDDPKRCEAFLRDYCGEYRREIFILISALKQDVAKDLLNSGNIPVEFLISKLINKMQSELGLTEEAARYAVESWAVVLDKMPLQQIQQPVIQQTNNINKPSQPIVPQQTTVKSPLFPNNQQQKPSFDRGILVKVGLAIGLPALAIIAQQMFQYIPITALTRYTKLESLLKSQDFKKADLETDRVILAITTKEGEVQKVENFPCQELRTIDNLWLKYSQGKFGISVQQDIYQRLGGTKETNWNVYTSFSDQIGWRQGGEWISYNNLNFSETAPWGHLPFVYLGKGGWEKRTSLMSRYAECKT
ncbi:hypothetical protein B7O87_05070 [Cylindrospermopsis raciborskii CENA303]|uniref:GUN4-like domain-containing protein n=1 Tax=Cylindrospermopsis raciborskii CENA303 TaxID=1170769 RepID=A0A1X4G9R1_9CYAN|nr:GUN4 domain-containing protein [Cylindrospermopsis raciborskii]OSO93924.1 hypothetical protein B7O87_05070 [Cylindrospermopsis raciborskii CENA303]